MSPTASELWCKESQHQVLRCTHLLQPLLTNGRQTPKIQESPGPRTVSRREQPKETKCKFFVSWTPCISILTSMRHQHRPKESWQLAFRLIDTTTNGPSLLPIQGRISLLV